MFQGVGHPNSWQCLGNGSQQRPGVGEYEDDRPIVLVTIQVSTLPAPHSSEKKVIMPANKHQKGFSGLPPEPIFHIPQTLNLKSESRHPNHTAKSFGLPAPQGIDCGTKLIIPITSPEPFYKIKSQLATLSYFLGDRNFRY